MDRPLFVYGTLRRGSQNEFARLLQAKSDFISIGRLPGSLYRIAHYPGWVEEDLGGWVTGEIWRPRDSSGWIQQLDEYEGDCYRRVSRNVETSAGAVDCWVYLYIESITGKKRIISGDWLVEL